MPDHEGEMLFIVSNASIQYILIYAGNGPLKYHQYLVTANSFRSLSQFEEAYRNLRNAHEYAMDLHTQRISQLEKWSYKHPFNRSIKHPATSKSAVRKDEDTASSRSSSSSVQKASKKSVKSKDSGCRAQSIVSHVTAADGGRDHLNAPLMSKGFKSSSPNVASSRSKTDDTDTIVQKCAQRSTVSDDSASRPDNTKGKHISQ